MLPNNDKSRIPISITSQRRSTKKAAVEKEVIVVVTPAKLERKNNNNNNNKSNLFSTTCSRMARESKDYNKRPTKPNYSNKKSPLSSTSITQVNKMNKNLRKSPITQLKEDLENLRQKKIDNESLIKNQNEEILKLQKQLVVKAELKRELLHKETLQQKLETLNAETEKLSIDVVDLLDVKSSSSTVDMLSYTNQIQELQSQLESREDAFKRKLDRYKKELKEKDQCIQKQQAINEQLKIDHANHIAQLNSIHMNRIQKLQTEHEKELATTNKPSTPSPININHIIEQALNEFEQEQHNHAPLPISIKPLVYHPPINKNQSKINQQWYSKSYVPLDAMSWPAPQSVPNLKRQLHI